MPAQQLYSLIYVSVNGALLTEEGSVDIKRMNDAQVIKTVAKGFAGMSPGAPMCEVDITSAIPSADFEFDPGPAMLSLSPVEIGLQVAGKVGVAKGFIVEQSLRHAVDSPSSMSIRAICQFPEFR
jgi:hypothetical protein